jgi:hypothetical protein
VIRFILAPILFVVGGFLTTAILSVLMICLVVEITVIRIYIDICMRIKNGCSKKVKEETATE